MAQTQATSTQQSNPDTTNGAKAATTKREPKTLTAIEAVQRIGKILDSLEDQQDRKRVLDFVRGGNGKDVE